MNFVSAPIYNRVISIVLKQGLDKGLLQVNHLPLNIPANEYLSIDHLTRVYELGEEHSNGFALIAGQGLQIDDYRTLGLAWKTAWSVRDILLRTIRFLILITNKGDFDLKEKGPYAHFLINNRPVDRKGQAISNEVTLIVLLNTIRKVTGQTIVPHRINFKHSNLKELSYYHDFFQCDILFNQTENCMSFHVKDLDIPSIKADKSVHRFIVERLEEEKKGMEKNPNLLVRDIKSLIKEALPSGTPSVVQISEHLCMSRRTLTRKLSEYDLTFRELVRKIQEETSKDLLQNRDLSIGDIAFQTGFSEQSAFNKAFKRWTGQSPTEFRKYSM